MQDNDGGRRARSLPVLVPVASDISEADFHSARFFLASFRVFRGSSDAQDDQLMAEGRTKPATSGARGLCNYAFRIV
jgi:hypothetical protein